MHYDQKIWIYILDVDSHNSDFYRRVWTAEPR